MVKTVTRYLVVRNVTTGDDLAYQYTAQQVETMDDITNALDEFTVVRLINDFLNKRARERAKYDSK